jgi:hypothetical protein
MGEIGTLATSMLLFIFRQHSLAWIKLLTKNPKTLSHGHTKINIQKMEYSKLECKRNK